MEPASNMNGIEGIAYVVMFILGFCLLGMLLVGPLAAFFATKGGRLGVASLVLGVLACLMGAVGVLLVVGFYALFGAGLTFPSSALPFLPPVASLALGVFALRLRSKRKAGVASVTTTNL